MSEPAPYINPATPEDYAALDSYVASVKAVIVANGFEATRDKVSLGEKVTESGYNTSPNIDFLPYAWMLLVPALNIGSMFYVGKYKEFSGGDPVKEAHRRIELAGGTLRPTVAPALPPAESDLWRDAAAGSTITRADGKRYRVESSAWGNFTRLLTADELAAEQAAKDAPAPTVEVAQIVQKFAKYLMGRMAITDKADAQVELLAGLDFLKTLK